MKRAFARVAVLCALICIVVPNLSAGGKREEAVPEPEPIIGGNTETAPDQEPSPPVPAEHSEEPVPAGSVADQTHDRESEVDREAELRTEIDALQARNTELEQENTELTELLDEAQFMLSLYVPDRSVSQRSERGRSQIDMVFEERENVFAPPPMVERIERNGHQTLLIDLGDRGVITHHRYNRATESLVVMEIERNRLETRATLLLQIVTPVSEEALYLESLQVSSGSESRYVDLSQVQRLTDANYRLERAFLPLDDRSIDILRLLLTPNSSIEFEGPRQSIVRMVPAAEREALSDMLYLYRELGGELYALSPRR